MGHAEGAAEVVGFELAIKDEYREKSQHLIAAVGAALTVVAHPGQVEKVIDSVYFFDAEGRPHYVSNVLFGSPTISQAFGALQLDRLAAACTAAAQDLAIGRCLRLLASSLMPDMDRFERFVTLWSSLEILVNKLFPGAREQFIASEDRRKLVAVDVCQRVHDDKAKLVDKFMVVMTQLRPANLTSDAVAFADVKRCRDALIHTGEAPENGLPLEPLAEILVNILSVHLNSR